MGHEASQRRRLRLLLVASGIVLALAALVGRLLVDARGALLAGQRAESAGDRANAIRWYQDAARLYVPGSPYVERALDQLASLATVAERTGDAVNARAALEAERAAILATRAIYTPHAARLPGIEQKLARFLAAAEDASVAPGANMATRMEWHRARLAQRPGPAVPFAVCALAGLGLWVGASIGFVTKGLDAALRLRRDAAAIAGVVFVVGMAMFLVGLRLA